MAGASGVGCANNMHVPTKPEGGGHKRKRKMRQIVTNHSTLSVFEFPEVTYRRQQSKFT